MRCFLTAFDQAHRAADGSYWTFRHRNVPNPVLDALYYECAAKHWPESGTPIACDELRGGCARMHEDWVCWYRFIDGGRDTVGRPGRYVLLAAFVEQNHHQGWDWSGVLQSQHFQDMARQVRVPGPLPAPSSLELEWNPPLATKASAIAEEIVRTGSGIVESDDALPIVAEIGLAMPLDCHFDCFVIKEQGRCQIACEVRAVFTPQPIRAITLLDPATPVQSSEPQIGPISRIDLLCRRSHGSNAWKVQRIIHPSVGLIVAFCLGVTLGIVVGWSMRGARAELPRPPQPINCDVCIPVTPHLSDIDSHQ